MQTTLSAVGTPLVQLVGSSQDADPPSVAGPTHVVVGASQPLTASAGVAATPTSVVAASRSPAPSVARTVQSPHESEKFPAMLPPAAVGCGETAKR
jgi:hypothetical protein